MDYLCASSLETLERWLGERGEATYRAKQIVAWIHQRWNDDPRDMSDLSKTLRDRLQEDFISRSSEISRHLSDEAGVEKLLITLRDGERVEAVIIPAGDRRAFCLSTQVGCPVQCAFCASGAGGLTRNMEAGEIVEQFLITTRTLGRLPDNVVFMGVGEPLLNLSNLLDALGFITGADYVDLGHRRITISTSGWTPGIRRLAKLGKPWNLAVSLHAADDETRRRLIPDRFRKPVDDVLDAVLEHQRETRRIPTFEYTLLKGINDDPGHAAGLAEAARKCRAKINLIPYNPTSDAFERPAPETIRSFQNVLVKRGVPVTLRVERGSGIQAACGQLRG